MCNENRHSNEVYIRKLVAQFQITNGQNLLSIIKCRLSNEKQKNHFIISNTLAVCQSELCWHEVYAASSCTIHPYNHSFIHSRPSIHSSCAIIQVNVHKSLIEKVTVWVAHNVAFPLFVAVHNVAISIQYHF